MRTSYVYYIYEINLYNIIVYIKITKTNLDMLRIWMSVNAEGSLSFISVHLTELQH